jgi:hypothetical protein
MSTRQLIEVRLDHGVALECVEEALDLAVVELRP